MKEICGFKGKNGTFYEKKIDCEAADLDYDVRQIKNKLNNFSSYLSDSIRYNSHFSLSDDYAISEYAKEFVLKHVLMEADNFISVINEGRTLQSTLDKLKKQSDTKKKLSKIGFNSTPWWMELRWWK